MDTKQKQKIGIMGGTFNPIHNGHLIIAENARVQFGLDQVLFIPAGYPPHKSQKQVVTAYHRCHMISLAIQDNPYFALSRLEVDSVKISYTYLTLQKLQKHYENTELFFILGADSLFDLERWCEIETVLDCCTILAAYRSHQKQEYFTQQIAYLAQKFSCRIFPLHTPNFEVSSGEIRNRIHAGNTIRYLVPAEVEAYIRTQHLYGEYHEPN